MFFMYWNTLACMRMYLVNGTKEEGTNADMLLLLGNTVSVE
jgi:hypothetical protein